jgi:hypothetical protein
MDQKWSIVGQAKLDKPREQVREIRQPPGGICTVQRFWVRVFRGLIAAISGAGAKILFGSQDSITETRRDPRYIEDLQPRQKHVGGWSRGIPVSPK